MKRFTIDSWRLAMARLIGLRSSFLKIGLRRSPIGNSSGVALVITLALLVLVTIAVMAFFTRATSNRSIESSRSNRVLVDQVVESGEDYIIGLFLGQMTQNATTTVESGQIVHRVTEAAGMVPRRSLSQPSLTNNAEFRNLVRQSAPGADPNASADSTLTASQNGRQISAEKWNEPALIAGPGFSSARANELPTWVYLNRDGSVSANATANTVGRFAYNAYQVGGLLNPNLAGHPAGLSKANLAPLKATQAGAVLDVIPGISASDFINWREGTGGAGFAQRVATSRQSGFHRPTGKSFHNRRDLIRFSRQGNLGLTAEALPFLTHFQFSVNAPAWDPSTPTGSTINYSANALSTSSPNRFVPGVRVVGTFTRPDGTQARPGDPLINRRFPLSRIRGLGRAGVDATLPSTMVNGQFVPASTSTVQRDFGLVWSGPQSRWEYRGATGSAVRTSILNLHEVAQQNREPDFFEILKAAILAGSLGKSGGNANSRTEIFDQTSDYQIIQIGANIIDQFRAGDIPMEIAFDEPKAPPFIGVVNLPYVNKIGRLIYRPPSGATTALGTQPAFRPHVGAWFVPEFWRPHQLSRFAESGTTPAKIRFRAQAGDQAYLALTIGTNHINYPSQEFLYQAGPTDGSGNSSGIRVFSGSSWLEINATSPLLNVPRYPTSALSAAAGESLGNISDPGGFGSLAGINAGFYNCPDTRIPGTPAQDSGRRTQYVLVSSAIVTEPLVTFYVEYETSPGSNDWKTLDMVKNLENSTTVNMWELGLWGNMGPNNGVVNTETAFDNTRFLPGEFHPSLRTLVGAVPASAAFRIDPRSDRFGTSNGYATQPGFNRRPFQTAGTYSYATPEVLPQIPFNAGSYDALSGVRARGVNGNTKLISGAGWSPTNGDGWGNYPLALVRNISNGTLSYRDNDGVLRRAAGAYQDFSQDNTAMLPVMLNRTFTSPGDLGYVHRGEPWKDLDFFTPESGDAGLLEFFSVDEEPALVAGRINLNTAPREVLEALLRGTILDESDSGLPTLSDAQAATIATGLVNTAGTAPFKSLADLVTGFSGTTALSAFPIKRQREAAIRVLSGCGDTRTWNLLIDVIAQSGRFEPGSHRVDAETRRWVHVALDRLTGRIVARQVENISE